jgi:hypothetical protein
MYRLHVVPFSEGGLFEALANLHASPDEVAQLDSAKYLFHYLASETVDARTIVIEEPYTDADYLDDFTSHYARCFAQYPRRCKRLHFFGRDLDEAGLLEIVRCPLGKESDPVRALQADYLGFVVARPLPQAIIGRSVLRTYSGVTDGRHFPATRAYKVNLYGIELEIVGLAYQEQDTVLAACATVALWSAFHKDSDLFETGIPTPAAITRAGTQTSHYGRSVPQHGLRIEEMCAAIRDIGLDPEAFDLKKTKDVPLVSLIYGYLAMGLPVILVVDVPGRGCHAITVVGYSESRGVRRVEEVPGKSRILPMKGLTIDKLYGHDDQIGAYAKLIVPGPACPETPADALKSSWEDSAGRPFVYPVAVVVPVYNKIRITFTDVQQWLMPIEYLMSAIRPPTRLPEWDVHLVFSNDYKKCVRLDGLLPDSVKESLLIAHHPRFWWRAVLRLDGLDFCEFLFDATGLARSHPVGTAVWKVESFALAMKKLLDDPVKSEAVDAVLRSRRLKEFLRQSINNRHDPGQTIRLTAADDNP